MNGTDITNERYCAMIYFRNLDFQSSPKIYDYDIKVRQRIVSPTFSFRARSPGYDDGWEEYITSGYSSLQT